MAMYYYHLPMLKLSSRPIPITHADGVTIGWMQRTYRSRSVKALTWVMDHLEVSVRGHNDQSGTTIQIRDTNKWLGRSAWQISLHSAANEIAMALQDKTKISTHPRLHWGQEESQWEIYKLPLSSETNIKHRQTGEIAAKITSVSLTKSNQRELKLMNDELDPVLVAALDYLLRIMY